MPNFRGHGDNFSKQTTLLAGVDIGPPQVLENDTFIEGKCNV